MSAAMWDTLVEQHNNPEPLGKPVYTYPYAFDGADVRSGHWHNYFVAMSGAVAPYEHQTMWPNAVRFWRWVGVIHKHLQHFYIILQHTHTTTGVSPQPGTAVLATRT